MSKGQIFSLAGRGQNRRATCIHGLVVESSQVRHRAETVATARYGIPPWVDHAIGVGILDSIGAGSPGKR